MCRFQLVNIWLWQAADTAQQVPSYHVFPSVFWPAPIYIPQVLGPANIWHGMQL